MTVTAPELVSTLVDGWAEAVQRWAEQSQSQSQALWDRSQDLWDRSAQLWDRWGEQWDPAGAPGHRHRHQHGGDLRARGGGGHHDDHGGLAHHDRRRHGPEHDHDHGCGCDHGGPAQHDHDDGHGCGGCGHCGCHDGGCRCCVPKADVVLHARAGERRIVSFRLRNPWRRERVVRIDVTPWQSSGGAGLSVTAVVDAAAITLQPCESRVVRLALAIGCERAAPAPDGHDAKPDAEQHAEPGAEPDPAGATVVTRPGEPADCDVTRCESGYVDVRFAGCARPQRVAVVVSPAHCDAIDGGCDCGCG